MRALLQRVRSASVKIEGEIRARIGPGLVILVGVGQGDGQGEVDFLSEKIANLRIFEDAEGKINRSILDTQGEALVVSQFTLYADTRKGRRPAFTDAALPDVARPLVERLADGLRTRGIPVQTGEFGAHMLVEIHNDGPVTIFLEK
jgi:D-tyrosyl-tRNA(Tyr) deacylase